MGEDEVNVIKSYINTDLKKDEAVVLVGHGTEHDSHKYYEQIEKLLRMNVNNIYIVNIEGSPYIDDVMDELKQKYKRVYLYPFLIVSGDHTLNDIGSDDEDSIRSKIATNGIDVKMFFTGLGENENAVNLFVDRLNGILIV